MRPSDINLEMAVAKEEGDAKFFIFGTPSVWNTMDAEQASRASQAFGVMPEVVQVPKRRLATVLKDYLDHSNLDFRNFDYRCQGYDKVYWNQMISLSTGRVSF